MKILESSLPLVDNADNVNKVFIPVSETCGHPTNI